MTLYYPYALVLGLVMSLMVFAGCVLARRGLILGGMILAAIVASPVTSFTRGAAGAIYASDMVSLVLILCWILPSTRAMLTTIVPLWYRKFVPLMILALVSVLFVAPLVTGSLTETEFAQRVRSPIPGLPLPVLMAGFRVMRIVLFIAYFAFAARLVMDKRTVRFTTKLVGLALIVLAACQLATYLGYADLSLYLPGAEHTRGHVLGHAKAAVGRLCAAGVFVALMLLYRSFFTPFYLLLFAVATAALFFSGSRAGFVGMAAGLLVLGAGARIGGKLVVAVLLGLAAAGLIYLAAIDPGRAERFGEILGSPTETRRWIIWSWVLKYLLTHPYYLVTGVGFSNFHYALANDQVDIAEHAHNDLLTCTTELGLVGLFLFVMYVYHLIRAVGRNYLHGSGETRWAALCLGSLLVGLVVSGLFEPSLYYSAGSAPMQRLLAVLFGVYTGWWIQCEYLQRAQREVMAGEAQTG